MENKKSKGKIIALVCSLVVVVGLATTGIVLAATGALSGLFSSDKAKAFDLLAEVPEKVLYSATNDVIGSDELSRNVLEKGLDLDVKISDVQVKEGNEDFAGFSMNLGAQMDLVNKKIGAKMAVGKNGENLSAEGYASLDEKKVAFSLPELIPNKAFAMTASDAKSQDVLTRFSEVLAMLPDLQDSLEEFVEEQGEVLYDGTECTPISNGYRLMIPKASMDEVLTNLQSWAGGQQATFGSIEEKLELSKGMISAGINAMVPVLTTYTKDFTFEIYEQDGKLSGISTNIKIEDVECAISATFNENGEQQEATVKIELTQNGNSLGEIVYTGLTKSGNVCEDTRKIAVTADGKEVVSYDERMTLDTKNNNAFEVNASMKMSGTELMSMASNGSIKNLEKGKCVTLQYDEVKLEQTPLYGSKSVASYAMEMTMSVLDGGVTMVSGEEVSMTPETADSVLSPYEKEVTKNFAAILEKWGINDAAGLSPSALDPVMSNYDSDVSSSLGDSASSYNPDDDGEDYDEDYDDGDYDDSGEDSDLDFEGDADSESTDDSENAEGDGSDLDDMF